MSPTLESPPDGQAYRETLLASPPRLLHLIVGLLVALLGAALVWAALTPVKNVVRVPGRVRPQTAEVAVRLPRDERIGTRVVEVHFQPGRPVVKDQPLFRLNTDGLKAAIRDAQEKVLDLERREGEQLARMEALPETHRQSLAQATTETDSARQEIASQEKTRLDLLDYVRERHRASEDEERRLRNAGTAFNRETILRAELNTKRLKTLVEMYSHPTSNAPVVVREAGLELMKRAHKSEMRQEELKLREIRLQLPRQREELSALRALETQAVVRAPLSGHVLLGEIRPGIELRRNEPALVLVGSAVEFEMLVPAEELDRFKLGTEVEIRLDGPTPSTMPGTVKYVAPDALPPREGDRSDLAIYQVRLALPREPDGTLRPGLTGSGEVEIGRQTLLEALLHDLRGAIRLD